MQTVMGKLRRQLTYAQSDGVSADSYELACINAFFSPKDSVLAEDAREKKLKAEARMGRLLIQSEITSYLRAYGLEHETDNVWVDCFHSRPDWLSDQAGKGSTFGEIRTALWMQLDQEYLHAKDYVEKWVMYDALFKELPVLIPVQNRS